MHTAHVCVLDCLSISRVIDVSPTTPPSSSSHTTPTVTVSTKHLNIRLTCTEQEDCAGPQARQRSMGLLATLLLIKTVWEERGCVAVS